MVLSQYWLLRKVYEGFMGDKMSNNKNSLALLKMIHKSQYASKDGDHKSAKESFKDIRSNIEQRVNKANIC